MEHEGLGESYAALQAHEIEQKLKQPGLLNRLIDASVENSKDWQARQTCEELFTKIDDELRVARYSHPLTWWAENCTALCLLFE